MRHLVSRLTYSNPATYNYFLSKTTHTVAFPDIRRIILRAFARNSVTLRKGN